MTRIAQLFAREIDRRIEEVIKVDDSDEGRVREELAEYVVTPSLEKQQASILEAYMEAYRKPHEGTAVWISGFFGSGKSSFAKMLGVSIQDRQLQGDGAAGLLIKQLHDKKTEVLLRQVVEHVPTEAVIFDVSTDRGIRQGNQSITEIMYRLFLQNLGYARELDLAELEITLEGDDRLEVFRDKYLELYGQAWDHEKGKPAIAINRASAVMHALEPQTFNAQDSWLKGAKGRGDITPNLLADRCLELMKRRRPTKRNLLFVVDEVGQFVARDPGKLEDLRAVVERLGQRGLGRIWVMVTSQEALSELVSGLDSTRIELPKVKDRFPLQVHLEPSDIAQVTSQRVLAKNAAAETRLRKLFEDNRARLESHTRIHAPNLALPPLTADGFMSLYPLLPYQVDMIISVVSGLRTQGGASKHVGGANRTIIKLAQQLLIHPEVDLQNQAIGTLATLDRIYDLVSGNISSEVRQKIEGIGAGTHPLARAVAKAVCLLQFERRVPRTAENIAATLHPSVEADSQLVEVKAALDALVAAQAVRLGEDGYRIPTPAEDDWERQRAELRPKQADTARIHSQVVAGLWAPPPAHTLLGVKPFRAGLIFNKNIVLMGDLPVHATLAATDEEWLKLREEWRQRSREEKTALFWIARSDDAIQRATDELFRSDEILARKERNATTRDETALVAEEKNTRRPKALAELKRLLRVALLEGTVYFRGNDRSPDKSSGDVSKACTGILGKVLPEVFDRFADAAGKVVAKDLEALLKTESLHGLPEVFATLRLTREEKGKPVFRTDGSPLAEVLARITNKASYGETASGRALADDLAKEPFGWDFDVVRLLVASLLRAGKVEVVSNGQVIDNALSLDARSALTDNNRFKQATFRPTVDIDIAVLSAAADHFQEVFGKEISELERGVVARTIRDKVQSHEASLQDIYTLLLANSLPGAAVLALALEQVRLIRSGTDDNAIQTFNASYAAVKEAIRREAELRAALTPPGLHDLARGSDAVVRLWPFLAAEPEAPADLANGAAELTDLLLKETFFRHLPRIDQLASKLESAYALRFQAAVAARRAAYEEAVAYVHATAEWGQLSADQQRQVLRPLSDPLKAAPASKTAIPQIRAETEACSARLATVIMAMLQLVDGNRIAPVKCSTYFSSGIDTTEQLDAALQGLRDECERLLGEGKKVLVQ